MSEWNGVTRYAAPVVLVFGTVLEQVHGHSKPHDHAEGHAPCRPQVGGRIQLTAATTSTVAPPWGPLVNMHGCTE